jgi:secreted trypsin-like serine protease
MLRTMRRTLLSVFALIGAGSLAAASPGPSPIVGGTQTTLGQYPNVVAIEVGEGLCSGTLITPNWVLTAAHCVTASVVMEPNQAAVTASIKVHFNTVDLSTSAGTIVTATNSIPDPGFNINDLGSHDSGLIELATPVTNVTPVVLNWNAALAPVGVNVTMVGFGETSGSGGGTVGTEYVVQQTSISCATDDGGIGSDADLLCYSQTDGKGKCDGDSGGPSFATINGKLIEVGSTSYGDQTCTMFGADTRIDAEYGWITSFVPELYCTDDTDCKTGNECFQNACIITPLQPMGIGSTCTGGSDCESGECVDGDGGDKCSMLCDLDNAATCPTGFTCEQATGAGSGSGICWSSGGGGCCDAGGASTGTSVLGFVFVGMVLRRRARRAARA